MPGTLIYSLFIIMMLFICGILYALPTAIILGFTHFSNKIKEKIYLIPLSVGFIDFLFDLVFQVRKKDRLTDFTPNYSFHFSIIWRVSLVMLFIIGLAVLITHLRKKLNKTIDFTVSDK